MKRRVAVFLLMLVLLFCGCSVQRGDYFAPLRGEFSAELDGSFRGMTFAARLLAGAAGEDGGRTATLTFYAPESLSDTVLCLDADGTLTLSGGGVTLAAPKGYACLLDLFFSYGPVTDVTVQDGVTQVVGENFSLSFDEEGALLFAQNEQVSVRVLSFCKMSK